MTQEYRNEDYDYTNEVAIEAMHPNLEFYQTILQRCRPSEREYYRAKVEKIISMANKIRP